MTPDYVTKVVNRYKKKRAALAIGNVLVNPHLVILCIVLTLLTYLLEQATDGTEWMQGKLENFMWMPFKQPKKSAYHASRQARNLCHRAKKQGTTS